nr:hypothetical protein [Tanacetum cinerariifolium]
MRNIKFKQFREQFKSTSRLFLGTNKVMQVALGRSDSNKIRSGLHKVSKNFAIHGGGYFDNLPGKGKPLNLNSNPHADPAEDTLYRILSKNSFAPKRVKLNKRIKSDIAEWRLTLKKACPCKESRDISKWNE